MASGFNSYEEARKKRLQENLKKIEGLGITAIKESLSEIAKCKTKKYSLSPMSKKGSAVIEVRRSTRARNLVSSYREDEFDDVERYLRSYNRRGCSKRAYNGAVASYDERIKATKRAEKFQDKLDPKNPSFVKPMVRSHVSSCFWLGLPTRFCKDHLPLEDVKMILEDENAEEYEVVYIGSRVGLSGGWRGFALDHGLDDGDALLFELVQSNRFKVYIFKAVDHTDEDDDNDAATDLEKVAGKLADVLEGEHASGHRETSSESTRSKGHINRAAKENSDIKPSDPQPITVKSTLEQGDEDAHGIQESQSRGVCSNDLSKMMPNQGGDEDDDEKPSSSERATKPSQEIMVKDETDVQDSQKGRMQYKGRVKRPPKCSRI